MKRNISALKENCYDVLIIGGGIFGACAAWDAALRGLSVALVEAKDFGSGASANSYKIVHGGIRYLQHADIIRVRSSCKERSALLRIAPHLVQPLPILIPTYGYGKMGKAFLGAGALLYDLLTFDRNRAIKDPSRKIPGVCFLNREEVLAQFPDVEQKSLTGGVLFNDGQIYNPTRLVLSFIKSAASEGAEVANYVQAEELLQSGARIDGIKARDLLTGSTFSLRAKVVVNAAGPWAEKLLKQTVGGTNYPKGSYSRDACFVIPKQFTSNYTLAIQGGTHDPDAVLSRPARHLFLTPWRNYTLVGVWHVVTEMDPDNIHVTQADLQNFIDEINEAFPVLNLTVDDVLMCNAGLVPFGDNEPEAVHLSYGKRSHLIDHEQLDQLSNFVTLIGVRYTMGRGDAAKAIDLVERKLGRSVCRSATECKPIYGGKIDDFELLVSQVNNEQPWVGSKEVIRALIHNYGSSYNEVMDYVDSDPSLKGVLGSSTVIKAELLHAINNEMAVKLSDLVFRRTDLATGEEPSEELLYSCALIAAKALGWNEERIQKEIQEVRSVIPNYTPGNISSEKQEVLNNTHSSTPDSRICI